jgi:hypothetical protein
MESDLNHYFYTCWSWSSRYVCRSQHRCRRTVFTRSHRAYSFLFSSVISNIIPLRISLVRYTYQVGPEVNNSR